MHYVGIDLHKRFLVVVVEDEAGRSWSARRFSCSDVAGLIKMLGAIRPFQAVIEASASYRWLYDLLCPLGEVVLAHPLRLRAIVAGRAKTDKLDAALLAKLLRGGMIPIAYIPPWPYERLRAVTRARARLIRRMTEAKNELHALLRRGNIQVPYANPFCKGGRRYIQAHDFGDIGNVCRDELLRRVEHYERETRSLDAALSEVAMQFPEVASLTDVYGIGLYSALLIIGEIGEPWRFPDGRKVGAYAGLTARVSQSGDTCYHGHITRQGSAWLRWILVEAAMKVVRRDKQLGNFYMRIRKRSSAKIARVAVARKLASICWVRLMRWHSLQAQTV